MVVGPDGGYMRSRHLQEEHHFEVIAGKVIGTSTASPSLAMGQATSVDAFAQALATAGVRDRPATVMPPGGAGSARATVRPNHQDRRARHLKDQQDTCSRQQVAYGMKYFRATTAISGLSCGRRP